MVRDAKELLSLMASKGHRIMVSPSGSTLTIYRGTGAWHNVCAYMGLGKQSQRDRLSHLLVEFFDGLDPDSFCYTEVMHLRAVRRKMEAMVREGPYGQDGIPALLLSFFGDKKWIHERFPSYRFNSKIVLESFRKLEKGIALQQAERLRKQAIECNIDGRKLMELLYRFTSMGVSQYQHWVSQELTVDQVFGLVAEASCYEQADMIQRLKTLRLLESLCPDILNLSEVDLPTWGRLVRQGTLTLARDIERYKEANGYSNEEFRQWLWEVYHRFIEENPSTYIWEFLFSDSGMAHVMDQDLMKKLRLKKEILSVSKRCAHEDTFVDEISQERYGKTLEKLPSKESKDFLEWYGVYEHLAAHLDQEDEDSDYQTIERFVQNKWGQSMRALSVKDFDHYLAETVMLPQLMDLVGQLEMDPSYGDALKESLKGQVEWTSHLYRGAIGRAKRQLRAWQAARNANLSQESFHAFALKQSEQDSLCAVTDDHWEEAEESLKRWHVLEKRWAECSLINVSIDEALSNRYSCKTLTELSRDNFQDLLVWFDGLCELERLSLQHMDLAKSLRPILRRRYGEGIETCVCLNAQQCHDFREWYRWAPKIQNMAISCGFDCESLDDLVRRWCGIREVKAECFQQVPTTLMEELKQWLSAYNAIQFQLEKSSHGVKTFAERTGYEAPNYTIEDLLLHYCQKTHGVHLYATRIEQLPHNLWWGVDSGAERPLWAASRRRAS